MPDKNLVARPKNVFDRWRERRSGYNARRSTPTARNNFNLLFRVISIDSKTGEPPRKDNKDYHPTKIFTKETLRYSFLLFLDFTVCSYS